MAVFRQRDRLGWKGRETWKAGGGSEGGALGEDFKDGELFL